jgi:hypothetical protein
MSEHASDNSRASAGVGNDEADELKATVSFLKTRRDM